MSEILIKGMEMLPEGFAYDVRIKGNGDVVDRQTGVVMGKAIKVPPHGDLKDYDSLGNKMSNLYMKNKEKWSPDYIEGFLRALKMLDKAPTVFEASKETE